MAVAPSTISISAIVVAAGLSSRMGGKSKLLLPWTGERTIIETTVQILLDSVVDDVIVVVGHDRELILSKLESLPLHTVINESFADGLSTSIVRGVEAAGETPGGYLIALGDMPTIEGNTIAVLCAQIARAGSGAIAVPAMGKRRGHPVVFGRGHREGLLALSGDKGARGLIEANENKLHEVVVDDVGIFADIDTFEAYAEARRMA